MNRNRNGFIPKFLKSEALFLQVFILLLKSKPTRTHET
ncbi:hypothetical protein AQPE_2619 [Aquipluma nitroreducens]|uniref:Uncharacterized protein n=1 Tax=Aquipluma nitroreducens TaxID=2010828 RepID=A0A5K7SAI7_9BACT|nr:hypothetical protein AQPE_2619 [Aquipluma nitroreducens]